VYFAARASAAASTSRDDACSEEAKPERVVIGRARIGPAIPFQVGLISCRAGERAMKIRARLNSSVEFL
jgi:hypothetical protein